MAYGFGSTDGTGTTDRVRVAGSITTQQSWAGWVYRQTLTGTSARWFECAGTPVSYSYFFSDDSTWAWGSVWSGGTGEWNRTGVTPAGSWIHLAVTYDGASSANNPIMYVNGATATVTRTSIPSGTVNTGANNIDLGNRAAGDRVLPGRLAEFGNWNRVLSADEVGALADGLTPLAFPSGLLTYLPLIRSVIDLRTAAASVTAGAVQPHPRICVPGLSSLIGVAPAVQVGFTATPTTAALSLTGLVPITTPDETWSDGTFWTDGTGWLSGDAAVQPNTAALTITGFAPTVITNINATVVPGTASLALSGQPPTEEVSSEILPAAAALTLTGYAPTINAPSSFTGQPNTAAITITGYAPDVITDAILAVSPLLGTVIQIESVIGQYISPETYFVTGNMVTSATVLGSVIQTSAIEGNIK